jgi:hypothetical protein
MGRRCELAGAVGARGRSARILTVCGEAEVGRILIQMGFGMLMEKAIEFYRGCCTVG